MEQEQEPTGRGPGGKQKTGDAPRHNTERGAPQERKYSVYKETWGHWTGEGTDLTFRKGDSSRKYTRQRDYEDLEHQGLKYRPYD